MIREGWAQAVLGDLVQPSKVKVDPAQIDDVPYIGLEHIEKDTGRLLGHGSSQDVKSTKTVFRKGDLLYGKLRPYLNKVHVAEYDGICSTDILVYPGSRHVSGKYLQYRLLSNDFVEYANRNVSGVQHPRVHVNAVNSFMIDLPPLNEQCRIVAKIDELFTKLEAAVQSLKQTQAFLKQYRQSVLKAAVEGELSREWRGAHQNELEPASKLLDRIHDEQSSWIESEAKRNNTEAKRLGAKRRKHNSQSPDAMQLPAKWSWTSLLAACWRVVDCHNKTAPYETSGVPLVRTTNIKNGRLMLDRVKYVSEDTYRFWSRRCPPEPGDILFTREAPMGEVAIIPPNTRVCMGQRMMLLRVFENLLSVRYLAYAMQEPQFQARLGAKQVGSGVQHLRVGDVESLAIPLPPLKEQHVIVGEIERRLSVGNKLEATIEANLKQAERLRQSILRQAFSGELVPQDPNDEPASVLLERIREERQNVEPKTRKKRAKLKRDVPAGDWVPELFPRQGG